jgi:hypothetical protein
MTPEEKWSIIDQARETLKRTENLTSTRPVIEETRAERWARESDEMDAAQRARQEELSLSRKTYRAMIDLQSDLSTMKHEVLQGFSGIAAFGEAISKELEALTTDVHDLRTRLTAAEAKLADTNVTPLKKKA